MLTFIETLSSANIYITIATDTDQSCSSAAPVAQ